MITTTSINPANTLPAEVPFYRTARALYPHRPDLWEPAFVYETLPPVPVDHPELPLFGDEAISPDHDEEVSRDDSLGGRTADDTRRNERARPPGRLDEPMPARMLNEFVYCPRLFFYEYVEGVFVESEDTERGSEIHKKVDKGRGDLPKAKKQEARSAEQGVAGTEQGRQTASLSHAEPSQVPGETKTMLSDENSPPAVATNVSVIHSRSATLGSERLGVVAKMDLIEVEMGEVTEVRVDGEESMIDASTVPASADAMKGGTALPSVSSGEAQTTQRVGKPAVNALPSAGSSRKKRARSDDGPDLFSLSAPVAEGTVEATPAAKLSAALIGDEVNLGSNETAATGQKTIVRRAIQRVTPVDYKAGAPRAEEHGNEMWDADKMQLGVQMLILRDNGYACDEGVIYYRATKQRVSLPMTEELERWVVEKIAAARRTAVGTIPAPLTDSPKCVRCSLAPVCLPDETRMLARTFGTREHVTGPAARGAASWDVDSTRDGMTGLGPTPDTLRVTKPPRRLIAARDDERALYLNTPGYRVTLRDEVLVVKEENRVIHEIRTRDVSHVALFGNIQITTQTVQWLCEAEIPVAYFSMGGWFYGLTRGHGLKNVFTRIEQFQSAQDEHRCLALAQRFVHGKIRNHRTQLMRNHVNLPASVGLKLKHAAGDALNARSIEELLGIEGAAAALYFQNFAGMIKVEADDDELPGIEPPTRPPQPEFKFDFTKRTRRPPTDPVNALLSLSYSLLAKDCTLAALAVGFDPYIGFYHQPRFGRPALALDLMEEFRPIVADSAVLTALNNRMITPGHFVQAGEAVNLTTHGRRAFFQAYEQRMNSLVTHPVFDYKASYRRVLELQARMLARYLTGEIAEYVPMMTR